MRSFALIGLLCATPLSAQWHLQGSPTSVDLHGIDAVSPEIAWASGANGTILRTTDAGAHWTPCPTPPDAEHLDFRGIQAFDAQTSIVMSSGKGTLSRLYKTTDACAHWTLLFTNPDPQGSWDGLSIFARSESLPNRSYVFGTVVGHAVDGTFSIFQTVDGESWVKRVTVNRGPHGEGCKLDSFKSKRGEDPLSASNQTLLTFGPTNFLFVTGGSTARLAYTDHFDLDFCFLSRFGGFC